MINEILANVEIRNSSKPKIVQYFTEDINENFYFVELIMSILTTASVLYCQIIGSQTLQACIYLLRILTFPNIQINIFLLF